MLTNLLLIVALQTPVWNADSFAQEVVDEDPIERLYFEGRLTFDQVVLLKNPSGAAQTPSTTLQDILLRRMARQSETPDSGSGSTTFSLIELLGAIASLLIAGEVRIRAAKTAVHTERNENKNERYRAAMKTGETQ